MLEGWSEDQIDSFKEKLILMTDTERLTRLRELTTGVIGNSAAVPAHINIIEDAIDPDLAALEAWAVLYFTPIKGENHVP